MIIAMNNLRNKVLIVMGIIMLVCFLDDWFFRFSCLVFPLCAIIGLVYGLRYKEKRFTLFSSVGLVIGIGWAVYTLLLIRSM